MCPTQRDVGLSGFCVLGLSYKEILVVSDGFQADSLAVVL